MAALDRLPQSNLAPAPLQLAAFTAAGAGTTQSALLGTNGAAGVKVVVDITAITGTSPTLQVTIQGRDPASGQNWTILASANLTATGLTVLTVYPSLTAVANLVANDAMPPIFQVQWAIGGTSPQVTATIGVHLIP